MPCERPLTIVNPRYKGLTKVDLADKALSRYGLHLDEPPDYYITVPCGKCHSCQKKRLQNFRMRLMYEFTESKSAVFITLSFNDSALDEYKDNYNRAVCQFMDALRKKFGYELRHFFVMEYGNDKLYIDRHGNQKCGTERPHFHGLIFNMPSIDFFLWESVWNRGNGRLRDSSTPYNGFYKNPRGFLFVEAVREPEKCASYICKYLTKEYSKDKLTPRVITSCGLGVQYLTKDNVHRHLKELDTTLTVNGFPFSLPTYFRNKIFSDDDKISLVLKRYFDTTPFKRVVDGREYYDEDSYKAALERFSRKQQSLGLSPTPRAISKMPKRIRKARKDLLKTFDIPKVFEL